MDRTAQSAIRLGDYKLVKAWEKMKKNQLELFDLSQDNSETNNLADEVPEKTAELNKLLTKYLTDVHAETAMTGESTGE